MMFTKDDDSPSKTDTIENGVFCSWQSYRSRDQGLSTEDWLRYHFRPCDRHAIGLPVRSTTIINGGGLRRLLDIATLQPQKHADAARTSHILSGVHVGLFPRRLWKSVRCIALSIEVHQLAEFRKTSLEVLFCLPSSLNRHCRDVPRVVFWHCHLGMVLHQLHSNSFETRPSKVARSIVRSTFPLLPLISRLWRQSSRGVQEGTRAIRADCAGWTQPCISR